MLHTPSVSAQSVTLSVNPPVVSAIVKPGKTLLIAYTLTNRGDPIGVSSYVVPFHPGSNSGEMVFEKAMRGPITFNLENADLQLQQPFFLQTDQSQQLLLKMTVPDTTPNGDYYYAVMSETQPGNTESGSGNPVAKATIGSTILLTVSNDGQTTINPRIRKFDIATRYRFNLFGFRLNIAESTDAIPVILSVLNDGNNVITADGQIILRGNFGIQANFPLSPTNILAFSSRDVVASDSAHVDKKTRAATTLQGFFLGKYSVSTEVTFGDDSKKLYATTSFIAFPIKITFGLLVTLLVAYIVHKRLKEQKN